MVSTFNITTEGVDYEFTGFILLENEKEERGYNWLLTLPVDSFDSTVDIVDGDTTYRFTDVEFVPARTDTSIERHIRAVERVEQ